jgi:nitrogenase-stabilizing/protective protein
MDSLIERLKALSSAEDFLQFFGVPFDESVVRVNRLHLLKRFYQYLNRSEGLGGLGDVEMLRRYREMLSRAYQDFVVSTPATACASA